MTLHLWIICSFINNSCRGCFFHSRYIHTYFDALIRFQFYSGNALHFREQPFRMGQVLTYFPLHCVIIYFRWQSYLMGRPRSCWQAFLHPDKWELPRSLLTLQTHPQASMPSVRPTFWGRLQESSSRWDRNASFATSMVHVLRPSGMESTSNSSGPSIRTKVLYEVAVVRMDILDLNWILRWTTVLADGFTWSRNTTHDLKTIF